MKQLAEFRQETKERFLGGQIISTWTFYNLLETSVLEKMAKGLERDYDASTTGDLQRQPQRWLSERLGIVNRILEERNAEYPRTSAEKMWANVESGMATRILKFNRPR